MADRRHDASHPLQVVPMVGLATLSSLQLVLGPGSRVVLAMPGWSQALFAGTLFVGALAVLASTRGEGIRFARLEAVGMLLCAAALLVYTFSVPGAVGSLSLGWFFGAVGLGCMGRLGQVWGWLRRHNDRGAAT